MKYCTSYAQNEDIRKLVNEIRFPVSLLNRAIEYGIDHKDKRIIVEIRNLHNEKMPSIDQLKDLLAENINFSLDFYILSDLIEFSKAGGVNLMYHYPVMTWGLVQILSYYKVSDITIAEPLFFSMEKIKKNIKCNIRVCPCIAKQKIEYNVKNDYGIQHSFILPQHMPLYEKYIDVLDLMDSNIDREATLVQVYIKAKSYIGPLDALVSGIETQLPASIIDEEFVQKRLNCNQVCMENLDNCHYCPMYLSLFNTIKDNRI